MVGCKRNSLASGKWQAPTTPLGQIFAVDFAEVRLPISASQRDFLVLPEFANDPPVDVELRDAINKASKVVWKATIVRTEGVLDTDSRDLYAIARIDDPFGRHSDHPPLRIGQPVVASIGGITLHDVAILPRAAVRQLDKVVLVQRDELTLHPTTVTSLWSNAEHVIVDRSDIPEGMLLATTPMVFTPAGAKVDIIPSAVSTTATAGSSPTDSENTATR